MKIFKLSKLTEEQQFRMLMTLLYFSVMAAFIYVAYVYEQDKSLIMRDLAIVEGYVTFMFTGLWCISLL
jgi:hypothetical protein